LPVKDTTIEIKIQSFLKQSNIDFFTHQFITEIKHGYQCDILIPSLNMVIECDGDYWHKYPTGTENDKIRTKELLEKGFKVLRLWEHEIRLMDLDEFRIRLNRIGREKNG
jgi:very-short-patch-repair endonuclease